MGCLIHISNPCSDGSGFSCYFRDKEQETLRLVQHVQVTYSSNPWGPRAHTLSVPFRSIRRGSCIHSGLREVNKGQPPHLSLYFKRRILQKQD